MGRMVIPKRYIHVLSPRTCECGLICKRVFANITKYLERKSSRIIWWALNTMSSAIFIRDTLGRRQTHREGPMKMKAETGVMWPQATER